VRAGDSQAGRDAGKESQFHGLGVSQRAQRDQRNLARMTLFLTVAKRHVTVLSAPAYHSAG